MNNDNPIEKAQEVMKLIPHRYPFLLVDRIISYDKESLVANIKNNEEDLGGWLMFRSGVELEYFINANWAISLGYDHRSSGDLWEYNPGLETVKISVTKSFI